MSLKAFFRGFRKSRRRQAITHEVMELMAKTGCFSGPWRRRGVFRDHARRFLERYADGNLRARGELAAMTVGELRTMARVSELW